MNLGVGEGVIVLIHHRRGWSVFGSSDDAGFARDGSELLGVCVVVDG